MGKFLSVTEAAERIGVSESLVYQWVEERRIPHYRLAGKGVGNWLAKHLAAIDALYHRFGRDGLKDQPIADVNLLLSSKELQFRDAAKGRNLGEEQKAANRRLELEIKDLTAYMKGQLAVLSLSDLRAFRQPNRPQQQDKQRQFKPRDRDQGMER